MGGTASLSLRRPGAEDEAHAVEADTHAVALDAALEAVADHAGEIHAVGYRIVHGGPGRDGPAVLDAPIMEALEVLAALAPLHQPHNLAGVRVADRRFPRALLIQPSTRASPGCRTPTPSRGAMASLG